MQTRPLILSLASFVLLASLLACSPSSTATPAATQVPDPASQPEAATPTPPATVAPPTDAAGSGASQACANPLYPVDPDGTWQYAGTSSPTGAYSFTRTYPEVRADGFTEQDVWDSGLTRTGQWSCDNGDLKALSLGAGAGSITTGNLNFVVDSTTSEGVTLPATMDPGDTWSQTVRIEGTMTIAEGTSADATNEARLDCSAEGTESITVPAGTFDAMKVVCQVQMSITVTTAGLSIPPTTVNSTSTAWYAPNVGWVRSEDTSDFGSGTTELQSYSIP